nr:hypothetical protein [Tanacetum cinerariifolium]
VTVNSNIHSGGTSQIPATSPSVPTAGPPGTLTVPPGPSAVPTVEEDIPVKARTFKKMEEDRLGEKAAKRLHDKELAQMETQRAEVQRRRQQDILDSAMYYNE